MLPDPRKVSRKLATIALLAALGACQTVPKHPGFSAKQVAALQAAGFHEEDGNYELGVANRVLFGFDESAVIPDSAGMLKQLSSMLLGVGIHGAMIEGHTDSVGNAAYNMDLSLKRASSVRDLVVAGGMNPEEVRTKGLGATDPIASNASETGRQENRRVVILVTPADAAPLKP
jgi:OOP family OmpA-OmpF porin